MFNRNCPICHKILEYKHKSQLTYANRLQSKCRNCANTKIGKNTKCEQCSKMFYRRPSDMREKNFCSHKCSGLYYRGKFKGENSPSWKGGDKISQQRENERLRNLRARLKQNGVNLLGGKCKICGYNKCIAALDFHHPDPTIKTEKFLKKCETNWEQMKQCIENCILLCSNCHREHHWNEKRKLI